MFTNDNALCNTFSTSFALFVSYGVLRGHLEGLVNLSMANQGNCVKVYTHSKKSKGQQEKTIEFKG